MPMMMRVLLVLALAITPGAASAQSSQADTLGDMLISLFSTGTLTNILHLIIMGTILVGIGVSVRGILKLKEASESHGRVSYGEGLAHLAAGSFMSSIMTFLFIGMNSIGGSYLDTGVSLSGAAAKGAANFAAVAQGGGMSDGAAGLIGMASNFAINAAQPLAVVTIFVSMLIGIVLVGMSLVGFAKLKEEGGRKTFGGQAAQLVIGLMLTNTPWVVDNLLGSFGIPVSSMFGSLTSEGFMQLATKAQSSALAYSSVGESGAQISAALRHVVELAFLAIMPFGLIAFIKGMMMINSSAQGGQGGSSFGAGCVFVIAGVMLVNGFDVSCAVMSTFTGQDMAWCQ